MSMVVCNRCWTHIDTDFNAEDILIWEPEVVCVGCATAEELAEFEDAVEDYVEGTVGDEW